MMFTHIMVGTDSLAQAGAFYDATMTVLGVPRVSATDTRLYYSDGGPPFVVILPRNGKSATAANGATIGLVAADIPMVDAWHMAGLAHGGVDDGAPGPRESAPGIYIAYLRDPTGNKLCAHCRI
jgi:catechol 2,3-dioxygenase-like lactoylglutathione lyase family enzyme